MHYSPREIKEQADIARNRALDGQEKNFAIAVELGKLLLHESHSRSNNRKITPRSFKTEDSQSQHGLFFARQLLPRHTFWKSQEDMLLEQAKSALCSSGAAAPHKNPRSLTQ